MGKWETKKREKKDALFRTAFRLFTEKGFAKTTISDIVTEAGLAKGTFYLYFKDKYELRDKLIASKAAQLLSEAYATLDPQAVLRPETLILGMFDYIIERFEEEPALLQFIAKNLSWGIFKTAFQEKLPEESRQFYEYYLEVLEKNSIVCAEPELLLSQSSSWWIPPAITVFSTRIRYPCRNTARIFAGRSSVFFPCLLPTPVPNRIRLSHEDLRL